MSIAPVATDWLDTAESQRVLNFQRRTLDEYIDDVRAALGVRRYAVRLVRPMIRRRLLALSPYYPKTSGALHSRGVGSP